jgi:hypothetical protein
MQVGPRISGVNAAINGWSWPKRLNRHGACLTLVGVESGELAGEAAAAFAWGSLAVYTRFANGFGASIF